jgi:hypothetical protein
LDPRIEAISGRFDGNDHTPGISGVPDVVGIDFVKTSLDRFEYLSTR